MKKMILTIIFLISFLSCNTTEPIPPVDNTPPGKRDYAWSIDSVDYDSLPGKIELYSIWGSSPNDVWGAGFTEDVRNCLWHFDGEKWSRAVWNTPITTFGDGSKSLGGIWGTASDDVWAFGGKLFSNHDRIEPFIMRYDGSRWTEVMGDKSQMPIGFRDIYPIRKNHFWISSSEYVSEYKDGIWKKYYIGANYIIPSIEGTGNTVYLTAYPIGIDSLFLMKLKDNSFIIIDRTSLFGDGKFGQNGLLLASRKTYTFGLKGIFSTHLENEDIQTNNWQIDLKLTSGSGFRNGYKNNSKDIWGLGYPAIVFHYNGENWQQLILNNQDLEAAFTGIWGNGNEIFISDTENGIVFHGK